jgi:hypothetical protein
MREHTSHMYKILEENDVEEWGILQYNNQRGFNPKSIGNFGKGRGRWNFGRGGRGSIICYNFNQPGNLAHDSPNMCTTCTYCRALDHATKYFPLLVVKWKARGNRNHNPNQNVQKISAEKCNEGSRIAVVMHGGSRTRTDVVNEGKKKNQWVRMLAWQPSILNKKRRSMKGKGKNYLEKIREHQHCLRIM